MNSKRIKKQIAMVLMGVSIVGMAAVTTVNAKNNSDEKWSFKVFGNSGTSYTDPRQKQDTSPAYCNVEDYNGRSGDYLQIYLVDSNKGDFSKRMVKTVSGPGQYSVSSLAYENRGKVNVRMAFYAPYRATYSWSASGVWSPDSSGSYN